MTDTAAVKIRTIIDRRTACWRVGHLTWRNSEMASLMYVVICIGFLSKKAPPGLYGYITPIWAICKYIVQNRVYLLLSHGGFNISLLGIDKDKNGLICMYIGKYYIRKICAFKNISPPSTKNLSPLKEIRVSCVI